MPLDIQWFIYALITNGAITQADADSFSWEHFPPRPSVKLP